MEHSRLRKPALSQGEDTLPQNRRGRTSGQVGEVADFTKGQWHYERAPRFRRSKLDVTPPPLRCARLRSAPAALGSNCSGVSSAKEPQERR